jgi:hypothetical protein
MGQVQDIVKDHDVFTQDGFERAMQKVKHVPEGELHHLAGYSPSGGYCKPFQKAIALARAELGRRAAAEQRKLIWITAGIGFLGVVVGAVLQSFVAVVVPIILSSIGQ